MMPVRAMLFCVPKSRHEGWRNERVMEAVERLTGCSGCPLPPILSVHGVLTHSLPKLPVIIAFLTSL